MMIPGRIRRLQPGFNTVPRYLIERDFPEGLSIPLDESGVRICHAVVENNTADGVTWVHSYVTPDRRKTYCIYDGPTPESVRHAAARNKLPISRVTEVSVLNPYFYK